MRKLLGFTVFLATAFLPNAAVYTENTIPETSYEALEAAPPEKKDIEYIYPDEYGLTSEVIGVFENEGVGYDLVHGFSKGGADAYSSGTSTEFYYSDGFFASDPTVYDNGLSCMSMTLAMSCFPAGADNIWDGDIALRDIYKQGLVKQLLADIGFEDDTMYVGDATIAIPERHSIGVTVAFKETKTADGALDGKILIPVVIRGGAYYSEWAGNFTIGSEGEHEGFARAADTVMDTLKRYIEIKDLTKAVEEGKAIFWVTGYSRAGTVANLASKRIVDLWQSAGNKVFSYAFESPMGGTKENEKPGCDYSCLHTVVNDLDLIPKVVPECFGFERYGTVHYLSGIGTGAARENFIRQLSCLADPSIYSDSFQAATFCLELKNMQSGTFAKDIEGKYVEDLSVLEEQFMKKLTDIVFPERTDFSGTGDEASFGEAIAKIILALTEPGNELAKEIKEKFEGSYMIWGLGSAAALFDEINRYGERTEAETEKNLDMIYEKLVKDLLPVITRDEWQVLSRSMIKLAADAVKGDDKELYGSFIKNAVKIGINHVTQINMAWLRTENEMFDTCDGKGRSIDASGLEVSAPVAAFEKDGSNIRVMLSTPDNKGDSIYYSIVKNGETVVNKVSEERELSRYVYREPILLTVSEEEGECDYTLTAYSWQYGKLSADAKWDIKLKAGAEGESETESDPETEAGTESETEPETESDAEKESEAETGSESRAESILETESETEGRSETAFETGMGPETEKTENILPVLLIASAAALIVLTAIISAVAAGKRKKK